MKQTLYRTSKDSPIFRSLIEAAQSKDVTVVVELMARFDEDSNIRWARDLEDAGVGVFHGIVGRKTHCKLSLLVRRDLDGQVRRYAHLGTGNYNPVTARFYTDISLLTARPEITLAAQRVFNYLTAEAEAEHDAYEPLMVAPLTLAQDTLGLDCPRGGTRQGGAAGGHCCQDEWAAGAEDSGGAVCGVAGRRRDRPDRAGDVLAAPRGEGFERKDTGALGGRKVSGT